MAVKYLANLPSLHWLNHQGFGIPISCNQWGKINRQGICERFSGTVSCTSSLAQLQLWAVPPNIFILASIKLNRHGLGDFMLRVLWNTIVWFPGALSNVFSFTLYCLNRIRPSFMWLGILIHSLYVSCLIHSQIVICYNEGFVTCQIRVKRKAKYGKNTFQHKMWFVMWKNERKVFKTG